jgi:hypothetical protein
MLYATSMFLQEDFFLWLFGDFLNIALHIGMRVGSGGQLHSPRAMQQGGFSWRFCFSVNLFRCHLQFSKLVARIRHHIMLFMVSVHRQHHSDQAL